MKKKLPSTACPNCGQWQYPSPSGYLDCTNECATRKLAPQRFETLTFDGCGVNGRDEYRERIATFRNGEYAKQYGEIFARSPEVLAAARAMLAQLEKMQSAQPLNLHPIRELLNSLPSEV